MASVGQIWVWLSIGLIWAWNSAGQNYTRPQTSDTRSRDAACTQTCPRGAAGVLARVLDQRQDVVGERHVVVERRPEVEVVLVAGPAPQRVCRPDDARHLRVLVRRQRRHVGSVGSKRKKVLSVVFNAIIVDARDGKIFIPCLCCSEKMFQMKIATEKK